MKPLLGMAWTAALLLLGAGSRPAQAAWCNVFQVCCDSCGQQAASNYTPAVSYYAPESGCNTCPQQTCTTRYVQRCYYQPVTTYQTKSYYEPVTTYRTSYYYEPVTSYRYSCYYDPCSCSYQQVACPTTSYRLRSQCCPTQSWVQRCCQVPVTSYQQAFYYEPVTSCCTPPAPTCCPTGYNGYQPSVAQAPAQPGCTTPALQPQAASSYTPPVAAPQPPAVSEQTAPANPGVKEYPTPGSGSPLYDRQYSPTAPPPTIPPAATGLNRAVPPHLPVIAPAPIPAAQPPKVRLDRIVTGPISEVQGQVVRQDKSPQAGAQVMFLSAAPKGPQRWVTADATGQFRVTLDTGDWLVYVKGSDERPIFHSKIDVRDNETRQVTLVSR